MAHEGERVNIYLSSSAVFQPFILHCARLAVSLNKIRGGSAMQNESFLPFILHCARLAVSLNKIRGGSAMQNESFQPFILHCARLAVSLHLKLRMS